MVHYSKGFKISKLQNFEDANFSILKFRLKRMNSDFFVTFYYILVIKIIITDRGLIRQSTVVSKLQKHFISVNDVIT